MMVEKDKAVIDQDRWFFESPIHQAALQHELLSWAGTPFWDQTRGRSVKGVKADCVSFVAAVMEQVGAYQPRNSWAAYVTHNGGPAMLGVMLTTLRSIPNLVELPGVWGWPKFDAMAGDILVMSSGTAMHHMAIFTEHNTIWHCVERAGVCQANLRDATIQRYLVSVFRFKP